MSSSTSFFHVLVLSEIRSQSQRLELQHEKILHTDSTKATKGIITAVYFLQQFINPVLQKVPKV